MYVHTHTYSMYTYAIAYRLLIFVHINFSELLIYVAKLKPTKFDFLYLFILFSLNKKHCNNLYMLNLLTVILLFTIK